jgi:hypothetical protein
MKNELRGACQSTSRDRQRWIPKKYSFVKDGTRNFDIGDRTIKILFLREEIINFWGFKKEIKIF